MLTQAQWASQVQVEPESEKHKNPRNQDPEEGSEKWGRFGGNGQSHQLFVTFHEYFKQKRVKIDKAASKHLWNWPIHEKN